MWSSAFQSPKSASFDSDHTIAKPSLSKVPNPKTKICLKHASHPTPQLDGLIRESSNKERIETLRSLLADIIDEEHCFKCATEAAAQALFSYLRDLRDAKRNGDFSKEDKKALKKELKLLMKGVRRDIKNTESRP